MEGSGYKVFGEKLTHALPLSYAIREGCGGIRTRDPVLDDCSFTGIRREDIVLTANERQWTRILKAA